MLDSGAHSLFKEHVGRPNEGSYDFFESDDFWGFVDRYCEFLNQNKDKFAVYVNVDVIFNPELSWKVQKYMESKGLNPLPVFHNGEDLKWLKKYVDNYEYIGIGGLGQIVSKSQWAIGVGDPAFNIICDGNGYPKVKVHGFAMTSPELILTFPFYSVDSSSWMQFGKYGLIVIPRKISGKFVYDVPPLIINVSSRKKRKADKNHFDNLPYIERLHVYEYLEMIGLKMGESELKEVDFDRTKCEFPISNKEISDKEIIIERGVCNDGEIRSRANLRYYLDLEANIPPWPRKWIKNNKAMITTLPM
jgi:hypothetical protein